MTPVQTFKKELMIFAIKNDFFGYGSTCYKRSDGKYISIVDCERYEHTAHQLAEEFDTLDNAEKINIINYYAEKELGATP